jgi:hypothetical protein
MNVKIDQLESELAQKLVSPLKTTIPGQYQLRVSLLDAKGRKKRSDASANNWSPASGRIEIRFETCTAEPKTVTMPEELPKTGSKSSLAADPLDLELRLLRALERAESTPGWNFVSLKKFRDEILPHESFTPGAFQPTEVHWQEAIRSAIDKRLVLVGKVQNPRAPQFPVTTVRLNRLMPEVQAALGQPKSSLDFHPIHIKGEPLSATILRERR